MYRGDRYLLSGPINESSDFQYWSTAKGWVLREEATLFSFEETEDFERPPEALGWVKYQESGYKNYF
jgi:hypothetical protein